MSRGDPKFPPANLAARNLANHAKLLKGQYWRISHKNAPLIDWSDNAESRFSHPSLPCKVLYFASLKVTAFWERFGEDLRDQDPSTRAISEHLLAERVWKMLRCVSSLRVIDLTDPATIREIGADGATFLGLYPFTQQWTKALMDHPFAIDGLIYSSRLNTPKKCVALFERSHSAAALKVSVKDPHPIDDPIILEILTKERISLV